MSDLGKPRLSSEIAAKVQITVVDVNDCPPIFTQPEYNVTLLLPTYQNVAIVQVNATDRDQDEMSSNSGSTLHYEIVEETNKDGVFEMNSHTGVITTRYVKTSIPLSLVAYFLSIRLSGMEVSGQYKRVMNG